jgi:hypothetical protein
MEAYKAKIIEDWKINNYDVNTDDYKFAYYSNCFPKIIFGDIPNNILEITLKKAPNCELSFNCRIKLECKLTHNTNIYMLIVNSKTIISDHINAKILFISRNHNGQDLQATKARFVITTISNLHNFPNALAIFNYVYDPNICSSDCLLYINCDEAIINNNHVERYLLGNLVPKNSGQNYTVMQKLSELFWQLFELQKKFE